MKRFGFYSMPPLDYPPDELIASRRRDAPTGRLFLPGSPNEDIGRIGIGQGELEVTPLQMAMVAAAVANGGRLMAPHLTTGSSTATGGRSRRSSRPSTAR